MKFDELGTKHVTRIVRHLPKEISTLLIKEKENCYLAGGALRSILVGEKPNDWDFYFQNESSMTRVGIVINPVSVSISKFCKTLKTKDGSLIQLVSVVYGKPEEVLEKFDFSICKIILWYASGKGWKALVGTGFFEDLAVKRLRYVAPKGHPHAGSSLLRTRKFLARGYHLPVESLAKILTDLYCDNLTKYDSQLTEVAGKLYEVDPSDF